MVIATLVASGLGVVSADALMESLRKHFPDAKLTFNDRSRDKPRTVLYSIWVEPASDTSFTVVMFDSGDAFGLDGVDDQNEVAAVAIREALDTGNRVIAGDRDGSRFVDLVPGMTPMDVRNGWRPMEELSAPESDGS